MDAGLPSLDFTPRHGTWGAEEVLHFFERSRPRVLSDSECAAARCALLTWHDHFDPAHAIAQELETPIGSWLHAILHRREADYSNAKYWLHRAGGLPAAAMGLIPPPRDSNPSREIWSLLKFDLERGDGSSVGISSVCPIGSWDSTALVDACRAALRSGATPQLEFLKRLQALELLTILESRLE